MGKDVLRRRQFLGLNTKGLCLFVTRRIYSTSVQKKRLPRQYDRTRRTYFILVMELGSEKILNTVDFHVPSSNSKQFPSNTNIVLRMPRLYFAQTVFKIEKPPSGTGNTGTKLMVRQVQKPVALMSHIISKYTRSGSMLLDPLFTSIETAKAYLLLPKHRKFMAWDSNLDCVSNETIHDESICGTSSKQ